MATSSTPTSSRSVGRSKDGATSTPDEPRWDGPPLEAWSGAWTPQQVAAALDGVGVPWCVIGGWSIDLFLGEQTRRHEDLEIAVLRRDHRRVRAHLAPQLAFSAVGDGEIRALGLDEDLPESVHQSWGLDVDAGLWRVDVMVEPGDDDTWVFRRDERISAPRAEIVGTSAGGIPYLRPQASLLFKAKSETRPKDDADLAACVPHLDDAQRRWLIDAVTRQHPDHHWVGVLTEGLRS